MEKNYYSCSCIYIEGYIEDMKQLLFTLTKPKAPEPLTAQFTDRMDKQSAVKAYKEKYGKRNNVQLFPTGMFTFQVMLCAYLFLS